MKDGWFYTGVYSDVDSILYMNMEDTERNTVFDVPRAASASINYHALCMIKDRTISCTKGHRSWSICQCHI